MKKRIVFVLLVFSTIHVNAQNKWFSVYNDSAALMNDAHKISKIFVTDIQKLNPAIHFNPAIVLNTTPWLIYYSSDEKVNLPLWEQVVPELKDFTYKIAGGKKEGKKLFGLFFNGFYLPHELGHALQHKAGKEGLSGSYDNEYFANTAAMLWWKKQHKRKELKKCYSFLKKIIKNYPNPVPEGMDAGKYFTDNYEKILADKENYAYTYGYMQFTQFIKIYEDKSLPGFESFIKDFLAKQ